MRLHTYIQELLLSPSRNTSVPESNPSGKRLLFPGTPFPSNVCAHDVMGTHTHTHTRPLLPRCAAHLRSLPVWFSCSTSSSVAAPRALRSPAGQSVAPRLAARLPLFLPRLSHCTAPQSSPTSAGPAWPGKGRSRRRRDVGRPFGSPPGSLCASAAPRTSQQGCRAPSPSSSSPHPPLPPHAPSQLLLCPAPSFHVNPFQGRPSQAVPWLASQR